MNDDSLIPIRMVESYIFCPRQAWYRFAASEDPTNVHMERGLARHEQFDEAAIAGMSVFRHVPVAAPQLGVVGVLDEVRIEAADLLITEVKTARLAREVWPGIMMQLAVQRLALAEQVDRGGWYGPALPPRERWKIRTYFSTSQSYREVPWSQDLERRARETVERCRALMGAPCPPPGNVGRRCHACQVLDRCMPFESEILLEAAR